MFGWFRNQDASANFWGWLRKNTARIQAGLERDPQGTAAEIGREFERSFPGLAWEVGPNKSGPWLFCVSANGDRGLFPRVEQAVRAAPALPVWEVRAFRPRGSLDAAIDMGGRTLGYDDVWCGVRPEGGGVDLVLWVRGLTPERDRALSPAVLILLDNAVGEYDAVMKVRRLDRRPLPENPLRRPDFFPLSELPAYLDGLSGPSPGAGS
jgi:hypothetical protein